RTFEAGVLHPGGLIEEVRAAQVSGEDEVPGEAVSRLLGEGAVGDQVGQVLRGVARSVSGGDRDLAQGDRVPVDQAFGLETVLPVLAALAGDVGGCAGR